MVRTPALVTVASLERVTKTGTPEPFARRIWASVPAAVTWTALVPLP